MKDKSSSILDLISRGEYPKHEVNTKYGVFKMKFPSGWENATIEQRKSDMLGGRPVNSFSIPFLKEIEICSVLGVVITDYPDKIPQNMQGVNIIDFPDEEVKDSLYKEFCTFSKSTQSRITGNSEQKG
jgi:hypothetical protein